MSLKITVMGCGNSSGVPSVGNYWGACDPSEPRNIRTRCSLAVQSATTTLIVDTGPDFREQMNRFDIRNLDAVLYSHQHSDHCNGIDDLRTLFFRNGRKPIDVYGSEETFLDLERRFGFLFSGGNNEEFYPPMLNKKVFEQRDFGKTTVVGDISFVPYQINHGTCTVTGYRFGDLGYSVDMWKMDKTALDMLKGIKTWIVDGAAYHNPMNAVHACLEDIYEYNDVIGAEKVFISSLSTQMDYATLCDELPSGFYPAYDGLVFEI